MTGPSEYELWRDALMIGAALRIHRPCHTAEARSVRGRDSTMADCEHGHYENTETPECIGCGYGSYDQTTEWPCDTAQALGATR